MFTPVRVVRVAAASLAIAMVPLAVAAQPGERNGIGIEKAAPPDSIPADRPGFGDNPTLVAKGYFALEAGYQFDHNQGGGDTHTIPGLLLRSGVAENVELRLGFDGYLINNPGDDGAGNTAIGAKLGLMDESRYTPQLAVIPQVSFPTGDDGVAADKSEPEVRFAWSKGLTDRVSLGGNINFAKRVGDDGNRDLETAASIATGFSLTDRLGSYVEYYGIFPEGNDADDSHVINGGLAYLVSDYTQLDAFIGTGVNDTASEPFAGFGIAHLF